MSLSIRLITTAHNHHYLTMLPPFTPITSLTFHHHQCCSPLPPPFITSIDHHHPCITIHNFPLRASPSITIIYYLCIITHHMSTLPPPISASVAADLLHHQFQPLYNSIIINTTSHKTSIKISPYQHHYYHLQHSFVND